MWTGADFFVLTEAEVGEAQFSPGFFSRHRGDQSDPLLLSFLVIVVTSVSGVRQYFFRSEPQLLRSLKRGNQGSAIMLVGRFNGNMGDQ